MARCTAVLCWVQTLFCAVLAGVCGECMAGLLVRMTMKQCCVCTLPGVHQSDTTCTTCC